MELDELKERILRWENLHTEFKEWPVHLRRSPKTPSESFGPDDLAAGIVAFANTDGGQLILGIADNRQIVGVKEPDAVERTVDNVAYNNCEPTITIVQEVISIEGKKVIVVHVQWRLFKRNFFTNSGALDKPPFSHLR
jgi:ATP-dependent DNA helicase RecG